MNLHAISKKSPVYTMAWKLVTEGRLGKSFAGKTVTALVEPHFKQYPEQRLRQNVANALVDMCEQCVINRTAPGNYAINEK